MLADAVSEWFDYQLRHFAQGTLLTQPGAISVGVRLLTLAIAAVFWFRSWRPR
jgi:hypothetical protein